MAGKNETVYFGAKIPKEVHEALIEISKKTETTVSGLVRLALKNFVAEQSKNQINNS